MPLTEAQVLANPGMQQAANLFGPGLNVLSSALNNAVESGRRMVDLQSHQEDLFMSEREKLRLASERKGLEATRIFESDRAFKEDVLKDRRNYATDVFRDERNFGLQSQMQRGQLAVSQGNLAVNQDQLGIQRDQVDIMRSRANAEEIRAGALDKRYERADRREQVAEERQNSFDNFVKNQLNQANPEAGGNKPFIAGGGILGSAINSAVGGFKDFFHIGSDAGLDTADEDVQYVRQLQKNFFIEDIAPIWDKMTPKQQEIANKIKWRRRQTGGGVGKTPDQIDSGNLLEGMTAPAPKTSSGQQIYPDGVPTSALPIGPRGSSNALLGNKPVPVSTNPIRIPTGQAASGSDLLFPNGVDVLTGRSYMAGD